MVDWWQLPDVVRPWCPAETCLTLLGPAAAERQPSGAPATRCVAGGAAQPRAPGDKQRQGGRARRALQLFLKAIKILRCSNRAISAFFDKI